MENKKSNLIKIIIIIACISVVAILGSIFVNLGMDWYSTLIRPSEWIPDIFIPIMWSIIYIAFGIVLSIWISKSNIPQSTAVLLIINGILNILWCLLFFTINLKFVGNIAIILILIFSILLVSNISKSNRVYSYILAIYPIWVSIATTLNTAIWILN